MKVIKAYQCDFSKVYKKTKQAVKNHEDNCYHNTNNRACATCKNNRIDYEIIEEDKEPFYNWCTSKDIGLDNKTLTMHCELYKNNQRK